MIKFMIIYFFSGDTFTVCMEMITAVFDGPVCIWAAWAIYNNRSCRYIATILVSLAQLYGDILYYMTAYKEDFKHGPVGHPIYFWFYFVFMNAIWIVIPFILLVDACRNTFKAQILADKTNRSKKNK